jgi:uncharacterized protein (TIGR02246 family)
MKEQTPAMVERYFAAANAHDTDALASCFTPDAQVHDEGKVHRGTAAIRAWSQDVVRRYNPSFEVLEATQQGKESFITARVSGTFDGSPAEIDYIIAVSDAGLITSLRVP